MTRSIAACGAVLALLASGCASPEFRPLNAARGLPPELAAAYYDLDSNGQDVGDAKVWSTGEPDEQLVTGDVDGRTLHVGLRLRNETDSPMMLDLDDTQLELRTDRDAMLLIDRPAQALGDQSIPPFQTGRVDLLFQLPDDVNLKDVAGYELLWAVRTEGGARVAKSTTFLREKRAGGASPYYYRPYGALGWGYGPWGSSWGLGVGAGSYWWY
jgi:hypothetical protein